jgi:hypothetical protein
MKWKFGKLSFAVIAGMASITASFGKQTFNWDVSDLGTYVDEQSPDVMQDLINSGNLKSRVNVMTGVKGSEVIKLINSSPTLQAASSCGWTAEGGMVLTDETISTVRVKIQEEYCNEDLNDVWAQLMNVAGANAQDEEPPNFADAMLVYYQQRAQELDENLMINGDTTSLVDSLAHYDGYAKLWDNDTDLNVAYSTETAITASNGFDVLMTVFNEVPTIVKRHKDTIGFEIICGYETARACIDQVYNDKDYASTFNVTEENGEISFILPSTNVTVRSYPQLDGTSKVYGVCYKYMFYGTDLDNDIDGFTWKYSDYDEQLRFGVKWRSGVQYVFPAYFTRLRLTPTS